MIFDLILTTVWEHPVWAILGEIGVILGIVVSITKWMWNHYIKERDVEIKNLREEVALLDKKLTKANIKIAEMATAIEMTHEYLEKSTIVGSLKEHGRL